MWRALMTVLPMLVVSGLTIAVMAAVPADYKGKPFNGKAQEIPGKVIAAYFDVGGNGVTYHTKDNKNHGSGESNKGPEEKNNLRKDEGVSVAYTKTGTDKWAADGKQMDLDQYYVGWVAEGDWMTYTLDVKESGTYVVNMLGGVNAENTEVTLDFNNGAIKSGPVKVETTGYWHKYKVHNAICEVKLEKGLNVLTFTFSKQGNINLLWLEFVPKGKDAPAVTPTAAPKATSTEAPKATSTAAKKG